MKAWISPSASGLERNGLIIAMFLRWTKATFVMFLKCELKVNWASKITSKLRIGAEGDNWVFKS